MEFAIYLAQQSGTNAEVTEMLKRVRVVVVPIINGDGFNTSREAIDLADNSGDPGGAPSLAESAAPAARWPIAARTATGSARPLGPCDAQVGIDPEPRLRLRLGRPRREHAAQLADVPRYRPVVGTRTQAVHEFSQAHDVTSLPPSQLRLARPAPARPPHPGPAPDEARLKELGDAMGDDTGYTSQYGWQLYDTSGTTEDWNYGAAGTFGYTIELGPESGDGRNLHISYDRGVVEQWEGKGSRKGRGCARRCCASPSGRPRVRLRHGLRPRAGRANPAAEEDLQDLDEPGLPGAG